MYPEPTVDQVVVAVPIVVIQVKALLGKAMLAVHLAAASKDTVEVEAEAAQVALVMVVLLPVAVVLE
jgi:hypothetical protein